MSIHALLSYYQQQQDLFSVSRLHAGRIITTMEKWVLEIIGWLADEDFFVSGAELALVIKPSAHLPVFFQAKM